MLLGRPPPAGGEGAQAGERPHHYRGVGHALGAGRLDIWDLGEGEKGEC